MYQDVEFLKGLDFEAVIVDESQRLKGAKTSKSLRQLASVFRLLLYSEPIKVRVLLLIYLHWKS